MGNFDFLKGEWPKVYGSASRAEQYLLNDPPTAAFWARRTIETLVEHLYDLIGLREPYKTDLVALISDAEFKRVTGDAINAKLHFIRTLGNKAAHAGHQVPKPAAEQALRELHHVLIWAAYHYSTHPDVVPMDSQFDPQLAARSAPLSRDELIELARTIKAQDEAHARALEERDQAVAERDAEIARLREQVKAAQAAKVLKDTHDYREAETRDAFIDLLPQEAGWCLDQARDREYKVTGIPSSTGAGYVDYVLWGEDDAPVAIVEAKRTRRSPMEGQEQARLYADALERKFGRRPIIYCTNGYEHVLWDDASGYPPRPVSGFARRDELERMIQRRRTRQPLGQQPIDRGIASRYYQERAIRAVGEAFERRQRQALLVMATGTGKTRTAIALVKQLMNAGWVKKALFLADRQALVTQAHKHFVQHLPEAAPVNLLTDRNGEGRVYLSTYQTMMGLVTAADDDRGRRFGPEYFDLIVIDEAHRSVYAKYGFLFAHFDALLLGLTATPKDEVDHNTYRLFHLEDGVPTDAYGLDAAIADGYLVPPKGVSVGTKFLRGGITYDDLTDDEKDQWDALDWGEGDPPDAIGADELNRFLFNADTVDKVLKTLMIKGHKVAGGDRIAKTIIFAQNQKHAEFIGSRFDVGWPEHAGRYARVITHGVSYVDQLIDKFSQPGSDPHIAISVDMLDTGIDVPDVANLVFFKPVRSKTKFWQMIGRGTRLRPDLYGEGQDKEDFYVFDFCGNLEFFGQDLPGTEGSTQRSLTERIIERRLALLQGLDSAGPGGSAEDAALRTTTARLLHEFVSGMTLDNVLVRPHRRAVEKFSRAESWSAISPEDAREALALAGLPSGAALGGEAAKRFDLLILRAQVGQLEADAAVVDRVREVVQAIAEHLLTKTAIPVVADQAQLLDEVASTHWWVDVTPAMLEAVRVRMRDLASLVTTTTGRNPVYTDIEDTLGEERDIALPGTTPGLNWDRFVDKATAHMRAHESHMAIQRLRRNRPLTATDLRELETMLIEAGAQPAHLERARADAGGLGLFVRSLVGLERAAAMEAFAEFLDESTHSVAQIRLIEMIIAELTRNGAMDPGRLYESPFTDDLPRGVDMIFPNEEVDTIVEILRDVRERAGVA